MELLIYIYGFICFSMILFNLIYNAVLSGSEKKLTRRSTEFEQRIDQQLKKIRQGESLDPRHLQKLEKSLRKIRYFVAFDRALEQTCEDPSVTEQYLAGLDPILARLSEVYMKREDLQAAYFADFVSRWGADSHFSRKLESAMLRCVQKDSFYCKVNAIHALCRLGSGESLIRALELQDQKEERLHEKILTEAFLSFRGDHDQLMQTLLKKLDRFSEKAKIAVMNYIRFKSGSYCKEMYAIMENPKAEKEVRLAAIRYFAKYPYDRAKPLLLAFLGSKDRAQWEYAAISATALGSYGGEDVVSALKQAMGNPNWYVRYNAAASLDAYQLTYSQLYDVIGGEDKFAREMIQYRLERRELEERQ